MALPSDQIYLRSPYFVKLERTDLERIFIEVYIYTGELTTDKPAQPQYTLESTAFLNPTTGDKLAQIDISGYAKDYVDINYNGSFITNAVWIEYDLFYADVGDTALTQEGSTVQLTGLYGYGYYEDGYNPNLSDRILMSSDYVIVPEGEGARIPVLQDLLTGYVLSSNPDINVAEEIGDTLLTVSGLTTTENTANVIRYISTGAYPATQKVVLKYGGGSPDQYVRVYYKPECKYEAIKLTFVNRWGALQDFYCFAASRISMATNQTDYKSNVVRGGTYSTNEHQYKILENRD